MQIQDSGLLPVSDEAVERAVAEKIGRKPSVWLCTCGCQARAYYGRGHGMLWMCFNRTRREGVFPVIGFRSRYELEQFITYTITLKRLVMPMDDLFIVLRREFDGRPQLVN